MHWLDTSHGGGTRLGCDARYIAQLRAVVGSGDKAMLKRLQHMHHQLVQHHGMPQGSWGVERILQNLPSDQWEPALEGLSIDSDKWKRALAYLPGQRIYHDDELTIIYTIFSKKGRLHIFLAEFFSGPENPIGPGQTTVQDPDPHHPRRSPNRGILAPRHKTTARAYSKSGIYRIFRSPRAAGVSSGEFNPDVTTIKSPRRLSLNLANGSGHVIARIEILSDGQRKLCSYRPGRNVDR